MPSSPYVFMLGLLMGQYTLGGECNESWLCVRFFLHVYVNTHTNTHTCALLLLLPPPLPGYDASAKMAEESHNAARVAPLSIILAIAASGALTGGAGCCLLLPVHALLLAHGWLLCMTTAGVVGWLYLLAITFSIQDPATLLDPSNATKGNFVVGQIVLDACVARGLSRPR